METVFPRVYRENGKLYTENLTPGKTVYGEETIQVEGVEYRSWNPSRSKAAAAIMKNLDRFPVQPGTAVLYLGAASGTTVSHFSDIAVNGFITAVEVSPTPMKQLVTVAETRENIAPVLANARNPEEYREFIPGGEVDVVYQDIAQKDQVHIFKRNLQFLKNKGEGLLCVKAQSITSTEEAEDVFDEALEQLQTFCTVEETVELKPFHTDHLFIRCTT